MGGCGVGFAGLGQADIRPSAIGHRCALPACPRADSWRANPCHRPEGRKGTAPHCRPTCSPCYAALPAPLRARSTSWYRPVKCHARYHDRRLACAVSAWCVLGNHGRHLQCISNKKAPARIRRRGFLGLAWIDSGGVDGTRTRDPRRDRPGFSPTELPLLAGSLSLASCDTSQALRLGDPTGIRTPVLTVKG